MLKSLLSVLTKRIWHTLDLRGLSSLHFYLLAWYLRRSIRGMPTGTTIFTSALHGFRPMRGLHYKTVLCHIPTWWGVKYHYFSVFWLGTAELIAWSQGPVPPGYKQGWVHCLAPEASQKGNIDGIKHLYAWVSIRPWLPTIKWPCVKSYLVGSSINTSAFQPCEANNIIRFSSRMASPKPGSTCHLRLKRVKTGFIARCLRHP